MILRANLDAVRTRIAQACALAKRDPRDVALIAVSKNHPTESVRDVFQLGQRVFGENRVQELASKASALESLGVEWHMIGSVQTNKVKELLAVPGLALLHSLDRTKLADALQARLGSSTRKLDCLLEVNASGDANKHGVTTGDAANLLTHVERECPALEIMGVMAMGPLADDPMPTFTRVARLRDDLAQTCGRPLPILSLGMSGDLEAAIAAGSTMVRVGTSIFGARV